MMFIGAAIILPLTGQICNKYPYTFPILGALIFQVMGNILYAFSTEVWMVILARFVIGIGIGLTSGVCHTYWGEMTVKLDYVRREKNKKPVKDYLFIAYLFISNGGYIFAFGEKFT